jgi:hypothetical protein
MPHPRKLYQQTVRVLGTEMAEATKQAGEERELQQGEARAQVRQQRAEPQRSREVPEQSESQ